MLVLLHGFKLLCYVFCQIYFIEMVFEQRSDSHILIHRPSCLSAVKHNSHEATPPPQTHHPLVWAFPLWILTSNSLAIVFIQLNWIIIEIVHQILPYSLLSNFVLTPCDIPAIILDMCFYPHQLALSLTSPSLAGSVLLLFVSHIFLFDNSIPNSSED